MPSKSKAETETITTTSQNYQLKLFLREINHLLALIRTLIRIS